MRGSIPLSKEPIRKGRTSCHRILSLFQILVQALLKNWRHIYKMKKTFREKIDSSKCDYKFICWIIQAPVIKMIWISPGCHFYCHFHRMKRNLVLLNWKERSDLTTRLWPSTQMEGQQTSLEPLVWSLYLDTCLTNEMQIHCPPKSCTNR